MTLYDVGKYILYYPWSIWELETYDPKIGDYRKSQENGGLMVISWWFNGILPSGKRLHNCRKSRFSMGKLTTNGVKLPENMIITQQLETTINPCPMDPNSV